MDQARRPALWYQLTVAQCCRGAAVIACLAGLVLLVGSCSTYSSMRGWLDQQAGDGSADPYTPRLHVHVITFLRIAAGLLLLGGGMAWVFAPRLARAFDREIRRQYRLLARLWPSERSLLIAMLLTGCAAALVRWPYLDQPLRFDEAYTYLNYASQPLYVTVSKYDAPNNHIAHSILVRLTTFLGGNSPEVLRLPAFAMGCLTAVGCCWLAGRWGGIHAAWFAGLLICVSSPLVEYSTNARGYTLLHALTLGMLLIVDDWLTKPRQSAALLLAGLFAAGLWTIPTAAYPIAMILAVAAWGTMRDPLRPRRWLRCRQLLAAVVLGGLLTALLYAPVLLVSGWKVLVSSGAGQGRPVSAWWQEVRLAGRETWTLATRDESWLSLGLWLGVLLAGTVCDRIGRRRALTFLLGLAVCAVLVTIQRVAPPARTWLFLIPWLACLAAAGLAQCLAFVHPPWRRAACLSLTALLWGGIPTITMIQHDSIRRSTETGSLPDAEAIVRDLQPLLAPDEGVIAVSPASAPLAYYGLRQGLDRRHFDRPGTQGLRSDQGYVVASRQPAQTVNEILDQLGMPQLKELAAVSLWREYPSALVYRLQPRGDERLPHPADHSGPAGER